MPLVTLKKEVIPEYRGHVISAPVPETKGSVSFVSTAGLDASVAAGSAADPASTSTTTMEYRMLPHYWDCVPENEWDWGPKGRPIPVSPNNPRAGSRCVKIYEEEEKIRENRA